MTLTEKILARKAGLDELKPGAFIEIEPDLGLGNDITALMIRIDVNGAKRRDAIERRTKKLNKELGKLIKTAYSEINGILRGAMRRVARVEAKSVNDIVRKNLP